jgi:hypothetical protein
MIGNNMGSVRLEANRIFKTEEREFLKDRITEVETSSKNKIIRDIKEFKKCHQPRKA